MKESAKLGRLGEISELNNYVLGAILHFAVAIGGFILAKTPIMGQFVPLGLALAAGSPRMYTLTASIGAFFGYFIPVSGASGFRYITALFAIVSIKILLSGFIKLTKSPFVSFALAFTTSAVTGFATTTTGISPTSIIMVIAESVITGGSAYFIHRVSIIKVGSNLGLSSSELVSVVITINMFIMGLTPLKIGDLSLGRIIACVLILSAGRFGKEQAGAIAGICSGLAIALNDKNFIFIMGIFAFGGLCAGLFSTMGRVASALAFILSGGLVAVLASPDTSALACMLEVFAGSIIFLFLPKRAGVKLAELFTPPAQLPRLDGLRKSLVMRLEFASSALCDVAKTVEEVSDRLKKINAPDFDQMLKLVENDACKGCTLRINCWETKKEETLVALLEMTKSIKQGTYNCEADAPEEFGAKCLRLPAVGRSLFTHFSDYTSRLSAENRIKEVRSVVSDQFDGISDMLADLAEEFEHAQRYDTETAASIVQALKAMGIIAADCGCCIDKYGRMSIEIRIRNTTQATLNRAHIMRELEGVCEREFDPPCISEVSGEVFITLSERAVYSIEYGVSQIACGQARMCGDAYSYFSDGRGRTVMIVSDGMGNGGRAAVDGAMAAGLMSRLIKSGFGFDCSLRIVNSAMLFKSTDESLATIDIACIDLYTGQTELYKAGAAPTLVRRSGKTGKAECSSLPAGILREIGFDRAVVSLRNDDIVLLVSDGAVCDGVEWICAELEAFRDGTAQQLADHIASAAGRRRSDGHEDDITVMAAILQKAV